MNKREHERKHSPTSRSVVLVNGDGRRGWCCLLSTDATVALASVQLLTNDTGQMLPLLLFLSSPTDSPSGTLLSTLLKCQAFISSSPSQQLPTKDPTLTLGNSTLGSDSIRPDSLSSSF